MTIFEYLQQNPEQSQEVTGLMEGVTSLWARGLQAPSTPATSTLVDSAGPTVHRCVCCSSANPALRGIVFDRPDVAAAVKADSPAIVPNGRW